MGLSLFLNGRRVAADGIPPHATLLDFIRAQGLTGAKEGCAEGECGACTIVVVRERPPQAGEAVNELAQPLACARGSETHPRVCSTLPSRDRKGSGQHADSFTASGGLPHYVPVNSCLLFVPMVADQEVYTVEYLAEGGCLAPVQKAIAEAGGSQCGYCTPGFVMSLFAEQYRPGREGPCDPHAMSGNLCRCTGYRPIRDAALILDGPPPGPLLERLNQPAPELGPVAADGFARPQTLEECLAMLRARPEARLIAGGTDLVVESNLHGKRFPCLVSTEAIRELRVFRESESEIEIGAGLTLSEIDLPHPVWKEWQTLFASPLIRNRATLGGNLATASPIGDAAPLLLALDARVRIAGVSGERVVPLDKFFLGYRKTALQPGDVLVSVLLPKPLPERVRFYKAAKRRTDDISTVAACFAIHKDGIRMAFGGVAPIPVRAYAAEKAAPNEACEVLARTLRPIGDHRGSAAYRLALTQSLLEKFRSEAA